MRWLAPPVDGVFESTKVVEGQAFAMSRHLARMDRSLSGLGLSAADHDWIRSGVSAVLTAAGSMPLGKLRWWATGGIGPLGSDRDAHGRCGGRNLPHEFDP